MRSTHKRPFLPEDRGEAGHWKSHLIIGTDQQSAISTLVERQTRLVRPLHLASATAARCTTPSNVRLGAAPLTHWSGSLRSTAAPILRFTPCRRLGDEHAQARYSEGGPDHPCRGERRSKVLIARHCKGRNECASWHQLRVVPRQRKLRNSWVGLYQSVL
jgi:hypothetical protein